MSNIFFPRFFAKPTAGLLSAVPLAALCLSCASLPASYPADAYIPKPYLLASPALPAGVSLKIALITDLHNTIYGGSQSALIARVREASPDIILLAGDLMDKYTPPDGTRMLLEGLRGIPVYYATGNHEYMTKRVDELRDVIRSYGVTILSDEYVKVNARGVDLIIAGIEDPLKKKYEDKTYNQEAAMNAAFQDMDAENAAYSILIAHRPERIAHYLEYPFDLVVSGHAHGGQWRLSIAPNGLYAPNQGFFPKYAGGVYRHTRADGGETVHIVSRGLSLTHPKRVKRINNPPELVMLYLTRSP
jgi:predicted MPP superfamily phosphohydrolase